MTAAGTAAVPASDIEKIEGAIDRLRTFIEAAHYRGYDPYDALKSPLFRLPGLRSSHFLRFAAQQAVKRSPVNLRPLLFVPKGTNPVTLGLCLQGYVALLAEKDPAALASKSGFLLDRLEQLAASGYRGACWGYDFDWEARHARIPAYRPTVVATGIITHAVYLLHQSTGDVRAREMCLSAARFVLQDLHRTPGEADTFCFSYSPFDHQVVFNASMKAVRLLAQAFRLSGDEALRDVARRGAHFVIGHQREDGRWAYSTAPSGGRTDHYHTGYVLDCLDEYIRCTGDQTAAPALKRGVAFYLSRFFEDGSIPRFDSRHTFPVDSTAAAQALLTLTRFGETGRAAAVAGWMTDHMQDPSGSFYFRRYKWHTEKTPFMRWSNAWMFAGLCTLYRSLNS
jgi:hypothetical protein